MRGRQRPHDPGPDAGNAAVTAIARMAMPVKPGLGVRLWSVA